MKKKREAQRRNVSYLEMGRGGGLFPTWEQNAGPGGGMWVNAGENTRVYPLKQWYLFATYVM